VDRLRPGDRDAVLDLARDAPVWRHLGGPRSAERATAWASGVTASAGHRAIREDGLVGLLSLAPHHDGADMELSYLLASRCWGRGLATEVLGAGLARLGPETGLSRVVAETQVANARSVRLLERLGFVPERRVERFGAEQAIYAARLDPRGAASP
jgi:ribosomal-protein-alanine N-acetyltransferase